MGEGIIYEVWGFKYMLLDLFNIGVCLLGLGCGKIDSKVVIVNEI